MRHEFVIAEKEIQDYFMSKRFITIVAILLFLSAYSIIMGIGNYNISLTAYKQAQASIKQNPLYTEIINQYHQKIADAESRNAQDEIQTLKGLLDNTVNMPMPSILMVFNQFNQYFVIVGAALAIVIGFNAVSREKEEGTFKALLSHPIYRDSILNGKALGAIIVLTIVLAIVFLLTLSILIFNNIIPNGDDLIRIFFIYLLSVIYCTVFIFLSIMLSIISKNSMMSIMYLLGILLVIFVFTQLSTSIVDFIMGSEPQYLDMNPMSNGYISDNSTIISQYDAMANANIINYWNRYNLLNEILNIFSPPYNYNTISTSLLTNKGYAVNSFYIENKTITYSLSSVIINIFILFIEIIVLFFVSYIKFMRIDIT